MDKTSDVLNRHFYTYTLYSLKDKKFYTGFTTDLKKRIRSHENGENTATKNRRPFKLIYFEFFINEYDARSHEKFLKSGFGRSQLRKAIANTLLEFNAME